MVRAASLPAGASASPRRAIEPTASSKPLAAARDAPADATAVPRPANPSAWLTAPRSASACEAGITISPAWMFAGMSRGTSHAPFASAAAPWYAMTMPKVSAATPGAIAQPTTGIAATEAAAPAAATPASAEICEAAAAPVASAASASAADCSVVRCASAAPVAAVLEVSKPNHFANICAIWLKKPVLPLCWMPVRVAVPDAVAPVICACAAS